MLGGSNMLSTPQRNAHRTPKHASTPCRLQDYLNLSKNRTEARPSPERLDAQLRQIVQSRENEMQEIMEQMKNMMLHMKSLTDKVDNLTKEMTELRKENQKQHQQQQQQQHIQQQQNVNPAVDPEDFYDDKEYDLNSLSQPTVPENPLQQGLFAQLPDLMPTVTTNPSLQISLKQKIETPFRTRPETATTATTIIKDAPVNKALPVNVVITTSDTLPTTVPSTQPTLSVTIPPQYRSGGAVTFSATPITTTSMMAVASTTMTTTKSSSSNVPHCYQIPMPLQAIIPTTVNLPPTSAYVAPANINVPIYSNLTASPSNVTHTTSSSALLSQDSKIYGETGNKSIYEPVESPNTSTEVCKPEHDPISNFVPIIPLPAKVKVTTGEEDEDTLYCGRAKLFRFVDKEWKERGVGDVKLLRNSEGKVRLLMRRDQILKICANHLLRPDMELRMANNNKAWFWVANDFADEEVKLKKLCIRFKTAEEAMAFKEAFDQARFSLPAMSPIKPPKSEKVSSSDKDSSKTSQKSQLTQQAKISSTTEAPSDKSKSGTTTLEGFSFSSKPIIQEVSDTETGDSKKTEEPSKVSPFSGFTFTMSIGKAETKIATTTITSVASTPSASFVFGATPTTNSQSVLTSSTSNASPIFSSPTMSQNSAALRRPRLRRRLPPPGAMKQGSPNNEMIPQTENEQKLFVGTASLQCQCVNGTSAMQWKNKDTGSLMLLLNMKSGKLRLLLTDDASSKIYSHAIPLYMAFTYKNGTTVVNWTVPENAKEPGKTWSLHAATFSTPEMASQFYNVVSSCQQKLAKGSSPSEVAKELEKKTQVTSSESRSQNATEAKPPPLSELFKPPIGSWECNDCYTRNNATDMKCIASEAPLPSAASNKSSAVTTKPADSKPPLSELFKLPAGSWTCTGCYIVNSGTNVYCVACDSPKDPSQPPKPQQASIFQLNTSSSSAAPMTTFFFGIPKDTAKETTASSFNFRMPKAEDKGANDAKVTSSKLEETAGTNFVFGMPIKSSAGDSPFTFGSPAKSFGFNFTAKSPVKSSGGGETSEDEVLESENVHFSPIVPDKIEVKTGEKDAFNEYKASLELEGKQDDLVLKVCELLVDMDTGMDVRKLKYWVERADKLFPHHPVVFQLKEKLLTVEKPNNSSDDLEALIASELAARPTDVQLRIKLLNYYMSERKLDKAYEHAISVEAIVPHRDSIVWYQLLYELLTKYKETKSLDWSFWFFYISVSDKYAGLSLREQGSEMKKSIPEAAQAIFNFDQNLNEMKSKNFSEQYAFTEHLFTHMWGQLHFHLACLLLRKTKREQGSWNEAGRLCSPLLLTALHVAPLENRLRMQLENEGFKNQFNIWATEAAYRCCQAGYILQNYARDDIKKLMDKIDKFCTGLWRERIYQRIFVTRIHQDRMRNSFFCHFHSASNPPLRMCTANQLRTYSQIAQEVWPASLHHQIWLGMENRPQHKDAPYPDQTSRVFPALQFSVDDPNKAAPDSLCLIDIDAFLNAAILCSSAVLEEQQLGGFVNPEKLPTLPMDLTATLSTSNQDKWWSAAYKMYSKRENVNGDIGELRQELQQGLEVIRCIGNHGIHPVLLVHLARMFHYRAKMMKEKDEANGNVLKRSELYWTAALPLLERLQNNQTLRLSPSKLFNYQGKEMNNFELTNALEEGKLLLAQRLVRNEQYEHAIDALQAFKCPEASFQLAQIYKIFADEIVNSTPRESLTSEMRSQHIIMLSKARNCYYLTLDRLRNPGTNPKHPLNAELGTHITDIENELKRIDPDLGRGELSRNDIDGISDESYSPTHSAVDQAVTNSTLPILTMLGGSNMLSTPQRNAHRTPKHASTPCRLQDYLNLSKNRTEARPSPERLDAQLRQIVQSRENEMQEIMEQMKNMMLHMKSLTDKVDNLTKEMTESRKENQKQHQQQQQQQRIQQQQNVVEPPTSAYVAPANINAPIYSNLTASPSNVTHTTSSSALLSQDSKIHGETGNKSIYEPVESPNTSTEVCKPEHDPIPNFVPIIPLPAKVKVTTGEEDEDTLYCGRAKLFRFVDKEWKECGVGDVKLLRNSEGKVRLLMRRDQILKICANHLLRPDMELSPMANNNKAWFWVANDFADEEVKLEKLLIRFKTAEEAMAFKEAFDQARFSLPAMSPIKPPKSEKVSSSDKDSSKTSQKSQLTQQAKISSTTEAPSDKSKSGTTTLQGFSFSSKPIIQEVSDTETGDSKKTEEPSKVSPFSGFTFTMSISKAETKIATTTITSVASTPSASFVFGATPTTNSQSVLMSSTSNASPIFSSPTISQNSAALRRRLPPPGAMKQGSPNNEMVPQTENEQKLFVGTASLQCQCVNGTSAMQWKNKGTGSLMLLLNMKSGKLCLLLTDDASSKIYSHAIPLYMAFTYKNGITVVNWTVPENAKEPCKTWSLHAATFSTPEMASKFYNVVSSCQQKLAKGSSPSEVAKELEKKTQATSSESRSQNATEAKPPPLSELFKPPTGSWECNDCYTRNNATDMKCIASEAPPSAASNKSSAVTTKPADSKPPLSELFKLPAGSWTCTGCYIVNSGTNVYCVACDSPKDPSQPPKPQQASIFQLNTSSSSAAPMTTFSFGIPKDTAKEITASSFNFRMPKAEDKGANDAKVTSSKLEETAGTNFVFGMPIKSSAGDSPFTFGSPAKSFGFNFTAKSPVKSPGDGETSEDEVLESEDVHFSPIVPLPDKIEVKTGEEDEEVLYSHRAKLFRFDTAVKEWKERGLGDIKLLCHKETGKLRLIMRRDHVLKLCLNHMLSSELEFTPKDEKTWLWTTADYSEGEIEYMQFACRFKTSEIAADFKRAIDDARQNVKPSAVRSEKTGKLTTKTTSSPVKELEIIYEAKVTPEEKAAALKLQLPENFYAYKQKKDCPGCRGCRKPSIVLYPDIGQDLTKPVPEEKKVITQSKVSTRLSSGSENTGEITPGLAQSASVKNRFSFATSTAPFKSPTTPTNFDSSTMSFGTGDLKLFNDKKTTTFSFGMNPQFGANETAEKTTVNASLENLKICNPSSTQTTQTAAFNATSTAGQPIFGQPTSMIFKTPTFSFDADKNIFGGSKASTKTPIFGESSGDNAVSSSTAKTISPATTANSVPKTSSTVITTSTVTSSSQSSNSIFGANSTPFSKLTFGSSSPSSFGNSTTTTNIFGGVTTAPTTTNIFGGTAAPTTTLFGGTTVATTALFGGTTAVTTSNVFGRTTAPTTTNIFGGTTAAAVTNVFGTATNVFGGTATSTVFGAKPTDNVQKNEEVPNFFSANNMTFSTLAAAAAAATEAFKVDPNFSFAGAGSSVFGSKPSTSLNSSMAIQNKSREDSVQKEDNEEDDGEVDNEQEHDPQFEPIIPLPDAIEVRTGEEDEEKVFCHRAKLYRYDNATKEWKERGIGEMKILHHAGHGSYRLLLRREQVHKVVCNFLITSDVEFHPLSTSDQAWMWAGMNYAEQEPCVEQLAVKFKSSDLARQFKGHIDNIQQELREKRVIEGERCIGEVEDSEEHDRGNDVDEEQEEEEEDDEDEEEDEEDDQGMVPIIEKRATVFARWPNENKWESVGLGNLAIHYDSEIYAERIVLKLDDSEEYASNTIISMDTVMRVEGKECIWSGIDYALDPPVRRVLRAVFSSVQAAQQMHTFFEDGVDSAKQAGVVEYHEAE